MLGHHIGFFFFLFVNGVNYIRKSNVKSFLYFWYNLYLIIMYFLKKLLDFNTSFFNSWIWFAGVISEGFLIVLIYDQPSRSLGCVLFCLTLLMSPQLFLASIYLICSCPFIFNWSEIHITYRHTSEILWFQTRVIKQYQNKASQMNFSVSKCIQIMFTLYYRLISIQFSTFKKLGTYLS